MLGAEGGPGSNAERFTARKERPGPATHGSGEDGSQREVWRKLRAFRMFWVVWKKERRRGGPGCVVIAVYKASSVCGLKTTSNETQKCYRRTSCFRFYS